MSVQRSEELPEKRLPTHEEFCLGIWWSFYLSGLVPPAAKDIAATVGCSRKYAYKVIGRLERIRKGAAIIE
jgi:hypothetical protein